MKTSKPYEESLINALRDPQEASAYLNAALDDGDVGVFLLALKDVTRAQGGMSVVARQTKLNRENLYRMLSGRGNPRLRGVENLLKSMGLRLTVIPSQPAI